VLPPVFSVGPPDAPGDAPPALSIQRMPPELLPGALCFVLTYHFEAKPSHVVVPDNTAYALNGVTFVAEQPADRARQWRDVLVPDAALGGGDAEFVLGPHLLRWISPRVFEQETGRPWQPASHEYGELAMVHVLADNLERAGEMFASAGVPAEVVHAAKREPMFLVGPERVDGVLLAMTEVPVRQWLEGRRMRTGEVIQVALGSSVNRR
jgi:hypothetical protein